MTQFARGFFSAEQQEEYEKAFPGQTNQNAYNSFHPNNAELGPSNLGQGFPKKSRSKGKGRARRECTLSESDSDQDSTDYDGYTHKFRPSPPSSPEPDRSRRPPPPTSFSAPLRTSQDLPVRSSKEAPKTFKGKHTEVQLFIDHYDHLLNRCRVTDDHEKCEKVLTYCSIDVQNAIRTMEGFVQRKWNKLRREIHKYYDADRALQKYKPADVKTYSKKMRSRPCHNLTQWRKYFVKYNTIAGGPLDRGHLSREDYNTFFQLGIQLTLRQILENRILQTNPWRGDEDQYTVKEWNTAAEWYFRQNKYESLMISAEELGEGLDDGDSGIESESELSSSDDSDLDYEDYRKKKKICEKKKKQEKRREVERKKNEVCSEYTQMKKKSPA